MKNKNYRIVSDENGTFKINKDGSRFIGVSETTTRGSHPFHSVVSAEEISTKECFVTETTSPATARGKNGKIIQDILFQSNIIWLNETSSIVTHKGSSYFEGIQGAAKK